MRHPRRPQPLLALRDALFVLPAVLGAACVGGPPSQEGPDDEQLLELYTTSATYFYEDDNLSQAQEQAVKALEIEPNHKAMRRMIGWVRVRQGQAEDLIIAEQFFRKLVREGDENSATTLGLATTLERLGVGYEEAARDFRAGAREVPAGKDREAYADRTAQQAVELWNEAIAILEGTLEGGEGSTRAMNGLQRLYALRGDYEESLRWSEILLDRSRAELATWRRLLTDGNLTESEEQLYRTNEQASLDLCRNTHLFAATLLHRQGRSRDAVAHLDQVLASEPDLAQAYSQRGQLLLELGDFEDAKRDLNRFIGLSDAPFGHPDLERAFQLLAECESRGRG